MTTSWPAPEAFHKMYTTEVAGRSVDGVLTVKMEMPSGFDPNGKNEADLLSMLFDHEILDHDVRIGVLFCDPWFIYAQIDVGNALRSIIADHERKACGLRALMG